MDIFIGGVRDRNTALHGDLVAALINPHDQWKVMYSQLDAFLEEHEELRALVYKKPVESIISNPDNASSSSLSDVHNTNVKINKSNRASDTITETNCEVVVEEDAKEATATSAEHPNIKKKKHRRGNKKKNRKDVIEVLKDSFALQQESPMDDSVEIISSSSRLEIDTTSHEQSSDVVIVPPDQLSECDMTDGSNESVHSLALDFQDGLGLKNSVKSSSDDVNRGIKSVSQETKASISQSTLVYPSGERGEDKPRDSKEKLTKNKVRSYKKNRLRQDNLKHNTTKAAGSISVNEKGKNTQKIEINVEQAMKLPEWEKFVQKTATVVRIMERKHSMLAAGILKPFADNNPHMALFSPFDHRLPRMKIPIQKCPSNYLVRPKDFSNIILLAKIMEWNEPKFAFGELLRDIGRVGDVEAETESFLLENGIDYEEFPESIMKDLPPLPWTIPEAEIKKRTDLRSSVIFTIDPATARDLDDSVSCLKLPNGNFRVGVHIADASYFISADSELDQMAASRATSVYLVQKVIPMLPRPLCEELCSLNPGEDKLAFSVIWELTPTGTVLGEWFGRTIIRSCVKLSYDHAQSVIDEPDKVLNPEEFPQIYGGVPLGKIATIIKDLHILAQHLRAKRVQNGALRLNQPKIGFSLDWETKTPNGYFSQETKESNWLIEEFMLLANVSVAQKIYTDFPNLALLRKHPPPHDVQLDNSLKFLSLHDINLDGTSSKTLNESIQKYSGRDPFSLARMQLIVNLCSKPMQYAKYICAGVVPPQEHHHYALSVPCYTHFTSPIRRYPDIIVHRLLAAALDAERNPLPRYTSKTIEQITDHCNDKKQASKVVQEASNDIFLSLFVRHVGEIIEDGIIIGVLDKSVDVLLLRLGIIKRCYMERLPLDKFFLFQEGQKSVIVIEWRADPAANLPSQTQRLTYFDCVTVILSPFDNDALKVNALLARPGKLI